MTTADEQCARCGEDVSMRSPLFEERHTVVRRGKNVLLCGSCFAEQRESRDRRRGGITEEQRQRLENAALTFEPFLPGAH